MNRKNISARQLPENEIKNKSAHKSSIKPDSLLPMSLDTATWRVTTDKIQPRTPFLIIREQVGASHNSSFWLRTITSNKMTIWRHSLKGTTNKLDAPPKRPKRHSTWTVKY